MRHISNRDTKRYDLNKHSRAAEIIPIVDILDDGGKNPKRALKSGLENIPWDFHIPAHTIIFSGKIKSSN